MGLPQYNEILSLSNKEISEEITKTKNEIFNLRFRKATRQSFKCHELKNGKRKLTQLKTLLGTRLKENLTNETDSN